MAFLINQSPRWLDYSGIPDKLRSEISPFAWQILKRLIELDGLQNPEPDIFSEPVKSLCSTLGLKSGEIRDNLLALQNNGYIELYLPESDLEPIYMRIQIPLNTPISPQDIPMELGGLLGSIEPVRLKYYHPAELIENENRFKQILHCYFELCGLKLNSLVLDDLKEIEREFTLEEIKSAFAKAKKNKARSLRSVFRILYSKELKKNKKESIATFGREEE